MSATAKPNQGRLHEIDETFSSATAQSSKYSFKDIDHSKIPLAEEQWPVAIIGSSMVGKMVGLLLGYHGVKSVSFERHPAIATHPRAAGLNYRTSEILRQLHLENFTLEQSATEFDLNAGMILVERLVGGKTITRLQEHDPDKVSDITPSNWVWISQRMFEPILGQHAGHFNSTQLHGHEVVNYEEQPDGVIVVVRNVATGKLKKYKADYVVACDGHRSPTRQKEGIKWDGPGILRNSLSISFSADLRPYLGSRAVHGVIYISNSKIGGGFRLENGGKEGLLMVNNVGNVVDFQPGSTTIEQAKQYFYDCAGLDESTTPVELKTCSYWTMAAYAADRIASKGGRVFLAGDAAHIMPPTGGVGGNTGIADAHNLAWKLAYVVTGKASPSLLQSYSPERQPVDKFIMTEAYHRFLNRVVRQDPPAPEVPDIALDLGYKYSTGAFLRQENSPIPQNVVWDNPASPSSTAGSRFPHVFLVDAQDPNKRISSLDLIQRNFVLVTLNSDSPWLKAADGLSFKIDTYALNATSTPFRDPNGKMRVKGKLGDDNALLVRPDGFIAWRAEKVDGGHRELLKNALRSILGKEIE